LADSYPFSNLHSISNHGNPISRLPDRSRSQRRVLHCIGYLRWSGLWSVLRGQTSASQSDDVAISQNSLPHTEGMAATRTCFSQRVDSRRFPFEEPIHVGSRLLESDYRNGSMGPQRLQDESRALSSNREGDVAGRKSRAEKQTIIQIEPRGEAIGLVSFLPVKDIRSISRGQSREWSLEVSFSSPLPASFPSPQLWLMCISSSRLDSPRWHIYPSIGVNRNIYKSKMMHLLTSIESWQPFKKSRFAV
jgi:hypothetical protein